MKKEFILDSDLQIRTVAEYLLQVICTKKNTKATIITMEGDLGTGKTALVKEVGKLMLTSTMITSPTFVIMKFHKIQNPKIPYVNLVHIDAYRIQNEKEIFILGLGEIFKNNDNVVFIEWPQNLIGLDFSTSISIKIEHLGDTKRKVIITS